ncbi:MAG TPA: hypothetical protein VFV38_26660 [Ktedonobacteraceae bacterium]|nr:hypothetical protein [Ktedonobacteraceae bacterium]
MTISSNSSPQSNAWQTLRQCCAPELFCVPKTWTDPFRSPALEMPRSLEGAVRYIQNQVTGKPWCNAFALLSLLMVEHKNQYGTIMGRLSALHNGFERIFPALGLHSMADWNVDTHLMLYVTGQIRETDTQKKRYNFWRNYQASSRLMKRWLTNLPDEQQECYAPFVFPHPVDTHELGMLSGYGKVVLEQQEKRKEDTDAIMPFFADLRMHGRLRYNVITRLWRAYQRAINLVEEGKAQLPVTFTLTERENELTSAERFVFKLWDRQTLAHAHLEAFSAGTQSHIRNKKESYSNQRNSYLLEWVRPEKANENNAPSRIWFLELLEQDVLGDIENGKPEEVKRRREWIKTHGYEDQEAHGPFRSNTPGALLPPIQAGYSFFLKSIQKRTSITLIPIESLYVAVTFGMVALCILTANGMRVGELLQIRASRDGIVPIQLPPSPDAEDQTPTIHWAIQAVPKGHHTPKTYFLDDEHLRLLSLIKLMLCEHYQMNPQTGAELPKVTIRGTNRHRFASHSDHYLFQYNGLGLYDEDIRACLRFLLHGLVFQTLEGRQVIVYPHLLRHGFATWALNVAKEPVDIVAAILNQRNVNVTKYYGRPNPRLIAERSHGLMNQISSYIDVTEVALRSPEELRTLLQKAQKTHGTLNRTRGGRCLLCGECPIFFSCIGCSAKVPDPAQRDEVEEAKQVVLIQIERARKKGLALEAAQYEKRLRQCEAELREMDMIEACRADELREPEVNFDVEA